MSIEQFPLHWPANWPRTKTRERSRFKTTFDAARKELYRELSLMDVPDWNIILSTNLPLRRDGLPYATAKSGNDTGVAVYFRKLDQEKRYVFACDRWDRIEDNMRAIQHSIAAIRGIERWGASDMLERAFTGFAALPAPATESAHWWEVLGVDRTADLKSIEICYRTKMKGAHPDLGGSTLESQRLNKAISEARAAKGIT